MLFAGKNLSKWKAFGGMDWFGGRDDAVACSGCYLPMCNGTMVCKIREQCVGIEPKVGNQQRQSPMICVF